MQKWQDVFVDEDAQLSEVVVPDHQDPREAYIEHIFNGPARFSANVVHRALKVYIHCTIHWWWIMKALAY